MKILPFSSKVKVMFPKLKQNNSSEVLTKKFVELAFISIDLTTHLITLIKDLCSNLLPVMVQMSLVPKILLVQCLDIGNSPCWIALLYVVLYTLSLLSHGNQLMQLFQSGSNQTLFYMGSIQIILEGGRDSPKAPKMIFPKMYNVNLC